MKLRLIGRDSALFVVPACDKRPPGSQTNTGGSGTMTSPSALFIRAMQILALFVLATLAHAARCQRSQKADDEFVLITF